MLNEINELMETATKNLKKSSKRRRKFKDAIAESEVATKKSELDVKRLRNELQSAKLLKKIEKIKGEA